MSEVFVVCNQLGQFWGKKKQWADGTNPKRVLCCDHQDEAINLLVELSSKDIDLRGEVTAVATNEKGVPQVTPSEHLIAEDPEPTPEASLDAGTSSDPEITPDADAESSAGESDETL